MLAPTKFPGKQEGSLGEGWKGVKEKVPKKQLLPFLVLASPSYSFTSSLCLSEGFLQLLTNFLGLFSNLWMGTTATPHKWWRPEVQMPTPRAPLILPKPGIVTSPIQ